ncbi:MAG: DUF1566 domain-containing protein [bacterium]|nr:DUF1566 domain-containing protein [bacterium]
MIQKNFFLMAALILSLASFLTASASAQNKVVVIPLMEEAPPLEPYAPLAVESPPTSAYFDNLFGGHVTDKVTGLVWQKSDDDDIKTWYEAWDYCQDLELPSGGWTDWHLPSVAELMSIVYYGKVNPPINTVFWSTNSSNYWSATTDASQSHSKWVVNFFYGSIYSEYKNIDNYVRCVRKKFAGYGNLKDNGNDTVTDLSTGLTWQQWDDDNKREWTVAVSYCQGLDLGGKKDWRLPTIKELQSIVDTSVNDPGPTIDSGAFPDTNSSDYWSATNYGGDSSFAWDVDFSNGRVAFDLKPLSFYVRCVR